MKIIPISEHPDAAKILYQLLEEREAHVNISHRAMPDWETHLAFIASEPYRHWYLIMKPVGVTVGAIYLTRAHEIGVQLFKFFRRNGYGTTAVELLMEMHGPRRYLANVNPSNEPSRKMFERLGFKLVQVTYALEAE